MVSNAATVPWQILKGVQSLEVVYGNIGYFFRLCQAQIDCDAKAASLTPFLRPPKSNASARRAEMKFKGLLSSGVSAGLTGNRDSLAFIGVGPERAVAAIRRTVASGCSVRLAFELPAYCTAKTGSEDHLNAACEGSVCAA
jgi:hypothetical protein